VHVRQSIHRGKYCGGNEVSLNADETRKACGFSQTRGDVTKYAQKSELSYGYG